MKIKSLVAMFLSIVCAASIASTLGAKSSGATAAKKALTQSMAALDSLDVTPPQFDQLKTAAQERAKKRSIASNLVASETLMSEPYKAFRNRFLAIKSPLEIDGLLDELDKNYDTYPADLKFAAAQLIPLRAMRGIVYRLVPVVDKERITRSILLTMVKQIASGLRVFFPADEASQWEAGFAYITEPFAQGPSDLQFTKISDLQDFVAGRILGELAQSARRIKAIDLTKDNVVLDNRLFYGSASYRDDIDRYRLIGEADKNAALSGIHAGISWAAAFCAYDMEDLFRVATAIGKIYGFDGFEFGLNGRQVDGAPAARRARVLKGFPKFLVLKESGPALMQSSFRQLYNSVGYATVAWNEIKSRSASDYWILDPQVFRPFDRQIGLTLANMEAMVRGPAEIHSIVTGDVVSVDMPAFFKNPPHDLKSLLPIAFETGGDRSKTVKDDAGQDVKVTFHNYFEGRALDWNAQAYAALLPGITKGADVAQRARVLSQSWGGGLGGAGFMFVGL